MKLKFYVHSGDKLFAIVHAESAEQAIVIACAKVDGQTATACTAIPIIADQYFVGLGGGDFANLSNDDFAGLK